MTACNTTRGALALLTTALLFGCGGSAVLDDKHSGGAAQHAGATAEFVPVPTVASIDWSLAPSRPAADGRLAPPALDGLAAPNASPNPQLPGWGRSVSVSTPSFAGLPALPQDAPLRQSSTAYTDSANPGSPLAKSANTQVGGSVASFNSSVATPAWAYYGLPAWSTKTSQTATISGTVPVKVNGFKSGIYIALANYSSSSWQFLPSVFNLSAPATVNFKAGADYISPGGNVYILLATWNGDVAEITSITTTGDDSNVAPTAALTLSTDLGYDGFATTLDATASSDSDLSIVQYEFDLGDGAGFLDNGSNPVLNTNINGVGGRLVSLRVTDEGGLTDTAQAVVLAVDPASYLPFSWYQARMNAGLGLASMGLGDIFGGAPHVFPNFFFEGLTAYAGYFDLRSKLPGWFDGWLADPEGFPETVDALQGRVAAAADIQELLLEANGQYWAQHQISAQNFNPTLDATQPLAAALAAFVTGAGGTANQANYQAALGSMPLPQQQALARVVLAASSARARRVTALTTLGLPPEAIAALFTAAHGDPIQNGLIALNTGQFIAALYDVTGGNYLLAGFPYAEAFFMGAAEVADALDQLRNFDTGVNPVWANVNLMIDTPAGRIIIAGTGADTHAAVLPDGHALLIDLGGADTYDCHAGANASPLNPVSVCIDLGNDNDIYNALDDPFDVDRTQNPSNDNTSQQGAGRMGIGILYESGGNDEYYSVRLSQGSAVAGVGILADLGGDDLYEFEALGQGGAFAGIGLLLDEDGADSYEAWQKAQGWGGIMGIGMLVDRGAATDTYLANPDLDAQRPEYAAFFGLAAVNKNLSLAQGSGNGLPINLLSIGDSKLAGGGGLGLLFDGGGTDTYTAGAFAQGGAHYQSTGLLLEVAGNETYTAYSYAQGAAANAGLAALLDSQGTDDYTLAVGPGQGAGDGIALAWLLELAGSDSYDAPAVALGTGRNNACGYLVDWAGGDQYTPHGPAFADTTLGRALLGTGNTALICYGMFVDDDGNDTYALGYANMANISLGTPPANDAVWMRLLDGAYTNGRGSGIDAP